MARAPQARCLHCGVRLPFYRKFTDGEFCSTLHRNAFQDDQRRLAMERLIETQQLCRTLVRHEAEPERTDKWPKPAGLLQIHLNFRASTLACVIAADPLAYDFVIGPRVPQYRSSAPPCDLRAGGNVLVPVRVAQVRRGLGGNALPIGSRVQLQPMLPATKFVLLMPPIPGRVNELRSIPPPHTADISHDAKKPTALRCAGRAWLPLAVDCHPDLAVMLPPPRLAPLRPLPLERAQRAGRENTIPLPLGVPSICKPGLPSNEVRKCMLRACPGSTAVTVAGPVDSHGSRPIATTAIPARVQSHAPWSRSRGLISALRCAGLQSLPAPASVKPPPAWQLKATDGHFSALAPELMKKPACVVAKCAPRPSLAGKVQLPTHAAVKGLTQSSAARIQAPLQFQSKAILPRIHLVPLQIGNEILAREPIAARVFGSSAPGRVLGQFFRRTPLSLQLMTVMIPLLLLIAVRAPSQPAAVRTMNGSSGALEKFLNARLRSVKSAIQNRAGIEIVDDFREGLDNWQSRRDTTANWSYDQAGFVKPATLAVYRPSMSMADYELEFLGQINRAALSWVMRAKDFENYYVAKLVLLKPGPLPVIGFVRYPVINGREGRHVSAPLGINVRADTIYRIRVDVRGADYSVYLQNQLVQFWSDSKLDRGGIGFFSPKGEQSSIKWVQISHQYDAIGRLCAYFTPFALATYNFEPEQGSSN